MKPERDPKTGYLTTGHEWNGITELNTPVPRLVFFFLIVTFLFSVGYWLLMPAFPTGSSFTKGLLGKDDRAQVTRAVRQAASDRAFWTDQIAKKSFSEIQADPRLMSDVRQTGRTLFGDNCSVCHGRSAGGRNGFPSLTTGSWLWGGTPEAIVETIRVGVNSPHANSRVSQMPAFGRDQVLKREEIDNVVAYVLSLSDPASQSKPARSKPLGDAATGKVVFAANCAVCHGADGKGKNDVGAPDLTDHSWIHGHSEDAIYMTVWGGLKGEMPSWEGRLSPVDLKILALYLVDLRKGKP